jgi:hypothetical protein
MTHHFLGVHPRERSRNYQPQAPGLSSGAAAGGAAVCLRAGKDQFRAAGAGRGLKGLRWIDRNFCADSELNYTGASE